MKLRLIFLAACLALLSTSHAGILARFKMAPLLGGTIDVELYEDKPATVANFIAYVKSGAWHNCVMHRWVSNYILQGGAYSRPFYEPMLEPIPINASNQLVDNRTTVTRFPPIPFEAHVGRRFSNLYGTIAMARVGGDTNSASADWFFNLKDNVNLDTQDGGYTVFGKTLRGTNILNLFTVSGSSGNSPLVYIDNTVYKWIHVDITLLTAQIAKVQNGLEISWESVEGATNTVEFTRAFPPVWETAEILSGTGARLAITNDPGTDVTRQYRVRINFPN